MVFVVTVGVVGVLTLMMTAVKVRILAVVVAMEAVTAVSTVADSQHLLVPSKHTPYCGLARHQTRHDRPTFFHALASLRGL